jgi:succinyl-CoA synthetase beta subunit
MTAGERAKAFVDEILIPREVDAELGGGLHVMRPNREPRPLAPRTDGGRMLGEAETKALLRAAGIDVPPGRVTDDAVSTWRELKGPVAVKRIGVTHKARDGGVVLDLDDEASIRAAEALDDVAVIPLPASEDRVAEALNTLRTPIPQEPITRLAQALQNLPLALIELNPVIVSATRAVAVDALAQEEIH